jgi:N-acetylglucosamine-6-phosphate deacetylase
VSAEPVRWLRGHVIGPRGVLEDRLLRLDGDRIGWVGVPSADPAGDRRAERLDGLLAPAFVDVHCHGGGGVDVLGPGIDALAQGGDRVIDETVDAMRAFARFHGARGIGAILPTAMAIPIPALRTWVAAVGVARDRQRAGWAAGERGRAEAEILGANIEGPALSTPKRGAHDPAFLVPPRVLLDALAADPGSWDALRIVTVAPEGEGGLELVRSLSSRGIIVSVGHTTASTGEARAAYDAGARSTTHLFNAMPALHHREPGPVGVVLADDRVHAEVIADGVHVHPMLLAPLSRLLRERLLYVSDAISSAGTGDGDIRFGTLEVTVRGAEARLGDGTLAGSVTPLDGAVAIAVAAGVPLHDAIAAAARVPARLLGARGRGAVRAGGRADLVLLDDAGRRHRTILRGRDLP